MRKQDANLSKFHHLITFTKWSLLCVPDIRFCRYTVHFGCCNSVCGLCYISNPQYTLSHASRDHTRSDICLPRSRARSDRYHPQGHNQLHFHTHTAGYNFRSNLLHILNIILVKISPNRQFLIPLGKDMMYSAQPCIHRYCRPWGANSVSDREKLCWYRTDS